MVLQYRVEFWNMAEPVNPNTNISQRQKNPVTYAESAIIHTSLDHGIASEYVDRISEREFDDFLNNNTKAAVPVLLDNIFDVNGVIEGAVHAHKVWIIRSDAVSWDNVLNNVINVIGAFYNESTEELKGSRIQLPPGAFRRDLKVNRFRLRPFGQRNRNQLCNQDKFNDCDIPAPPPAPPTTPMITNL